jgi:hypothetical protein
MKSDLKKRKKATRCQEIEVVVIATARGRVAAVAVHLQKQGSHSPETRSYRDLISAVHDASSAVKRHRLWLRLQAVLYSSSLASFLSAEGARGRNIKMDMETIQSSQTTRPTGRTGGRFDLCLHCLIFRAKR